MQLKIGLITLQPGWTLLLDQMGVWWEAGIDWECDLNQQYSLIIVNGPLAETGYINKLEAYLESGGSVIDQGYLIDSLENIQFGRTFKKTFYPEPTEYYTSHEPIDIYRNIWLHPNGVLCEGAVYTQQFGKGVGAFVGWEINPLMLDERASYKHFQHDGHPPPFERVSLVSKSEIRRFLFGLMKWLHLSRDIPFVHKWMFPGLAEQLFLFRVDTDFGTQEEISSLSDVTKSHEIPTTWFLHVEAHEKWLADFPHATDIDELAAHGYEHKATASFSFNEQNIQKAVDQLQQSGIDPQGFAVPYGYWNPALAEAIASFAFPYSSEFALSYNHYPYLVESYHFDVPLLQIPVHPICIGSFRRTKVMEEAILSYYMDIMKRFEAQHEPVALYHHPKDGHHDVLEETFNYVNKKAFHKYTFQAYARFWKQRHQHSFRAEWDGNHLEIEHRGDQPEMEIAICSHNTLQQASLWIENSSPGKTPQKSIAYTTPQTRTVEQQKKLRGFKPRLIKQVLLDIIYRP